MVVRRNYAGEAMRVIAILLTLFATLALTGCMTVPGSLGQYATHDRGNGTVDKSAPQYFAQPRYGYAY
jgi:hypothetical protein